MDKQRKSPKIGLALGAGGAKGLAHLGVLRVLEKNKIRIDCVAGSSIGAIVGAFYAAKGSIVPLYDLVEKIDWKMALSLIDPSFMGRGLIGGTRLEAFFRKHIGDITFANTKIPFRAVATDLKTNEKVVISRGKIAAAIRSSMSVPLVFKPAKKGRAVLTDGGLSDPVPVDVVRDMGADYVIAVNLDTASANGGRIEKVAREGHFNMYDIAVSSLQIIRYHLAKKCVAEADCVIEPSIRDSRFIVVGLDKFMSKDREKIIRAGEIAAEKAVVKIKKGLESRYG